MRVKKLLPTITLFFFVNLTLAENEKAYTVSVVPQLPALVLFEDWQPYLDYLEQEIGVKFKLYLSDTIPLFELDFLAGNPDFAFMNPYHAVMAYNTQGYLPLLSDGSRQLKGILVVRKDSSFQSVQDLDGADIAFPAPNAFGASLYMRALLAEQEKININPIYVKTHANSYRNVFFGRTSAGGGVVNTFHKESEDLQQNLRIIYETSGVTPHPLSVHPRVPKDIQERVIELTLALAQNETGLSLLKTIQLTMPIEVDYESDYKVLDELKLENYIVIEQ